MFKIIRTLPVEPKPIIDTWKEHLRADMVLKKNDMYFFCEECKEPEIISEYIFDKEKKEFVEINNKKKE